MSLLLLCSLALAGNPEKAEKLAYKASDALEDGDLNRALKLSQKALRQDPNNAMARFTRARLALIAYGGSDGETAAMLLQAGLDDLAVCAQQEPTWTCAGMYLDLLASTQGASLLPTEEIACPAEAVEAIQAAEALFNTRELDKSKAYYEEAIALCPAQPAWPTWYGDVYFSAGDMSTAIAWYDKALEVDPCYSSARRFKSDALLHVGDVRGAYTEAVRAVACDPTYETGWTHLQSIVDGTQGVWMRERVQKPRTSSDANSSTIGLSVTPGDPFGGGIGLAYGLGKQTGVGSPLQIERAAVRSVLTMLGDAPFADDAPPELALWRALAVAESDGYLDEAIFVLLLDEALVPEFLEYRVVNFQRLQDYISRHVALIP